jgi:hypothetical protein
MEDPPDEPTTSTSSFNKRTSDAAELDDCSNPLPNDRPSSSSSSGDHHNSKMARLASDATEASMELVETTLDEEMEVNVEVKGKGKERAAEGDSVLSPILKQAKLPEQEADMGVSDAVSRMADDIEQELWCGVSRPSSSLPRVSMPAHRSFPTDPSILLALRCHSSQARPPYAMLARCLRFLLLPLPIRSSLPLTFSLSAAGPFPLLLSSDPLFPLHLQSSSPSPSTCPSCRTTVTSALFSRTLSNLVDIVVW